MDLRASNHLRPRWLDGLRDGWSRAIYKIVNYDYFLAYGWPAALDIMAYSKRKRRVEGNAKNLVRIKLHS